MKFIATILMILSMSVQAQAGEVTLSSNDNFKLKGSFYKSIKDSDRAVLMLHQCNYNRSMYNDIGKQLAKRGIHALSIDFRGFGASISDKYNIEKFSQLTEDEQRKAWRTLRKNWPADVLTAYNFLKEQAGSDKSIGVIGASCGGSQAISLAELHPVKAISFFSSGQREANIKRYNDELADKATLIIAAEEDGGTYTSAQALFKKAKHQQSRFIAYKGAAHGYPLLDTDIYLGSVIVQWFDSQL